MNPHNLTLKQLRAFQAIADEGSFVAASKKLHLSQPALSQCVKQLEAELGGRLFDRTTRSVRLTSLGMSFLPYVRHLLAQLETVVTNMQELVSRRRGEVTIACLPSVASRLMPRVVAENERAFPGIRVNIRDANMRQVAEKVRSGEADLGIGSLYEEDPDVSSALLAEDEMQAVLPATSPLARHRRLAWDDLADAPFISLSHDNGVRDLLDAALRQHAIRVRTVAEVSNISTLTAMVEEGIGISVLPSLAMPRASHQVVRVRPLRPLVNRTIHLLWRTGIAISPAAEAVRISLQKVVAEDPELKHLPHVIWTEGPSWLKEASSL
ncbi:LysR family transcriptional regulator [Acuticoccus mangrovi]|uniref:LysR family transcriptional regulator n=1 Tax=Acuticoccus mangrovi TaxID=2796142 RepID=A0A934MF21_9HYPH|nr:LysR family transcriptional regulator [Acuticoccus mangrovi]MBJ3774460.1 LysR family transcriptional regulator [Acuticoccus mangrovi]